MYSIKNINFSLANRYRRLSSLALILGLCAHSPASWGLSLHEILEYSLNNDPSILEAKENEIAAGYQVKSSKALNYPIVSVSANRNIFEKNRFKTEKNKKIEPALNTVLNIYSWGKISSTIKKDKEQEHYFHQEFFNKQEELGYQIARLYIEAIRSVEAIKAYEKNIQRHKKIVTELEIITSHDKGRQSELVEAQTKLLSIETNIRKEIKNLDLNLSQLSKYINKELNENDLEYPFAGATAQDVINKYNDIDIKTNPLYLLQEAELKRQRYDVEAMLTHKLPNINLQSSITKDDKLVFLNVNWNILDEVTRNSSKKGLAQVNAAYERLNQTTRDLQQQINSSLADMHANEGVIKKATEHLKSQEKVIESYELQYKIARRSLTDLLGAYSEVSNIEMMKINSQKDYYDAILNYLKANAKIYEWFVGQNNMPASYKPGDKTNFVSHQSKESHLQAGEDLTNPIADDYPNTAEKLAKPTVVDQLKTTEKQPTPPVSTELLPRVKKTKNTSAMETIDKVAKDSTETTATELTAKTADSATKASTKTTVTESTAKKVANVTEASSETTTTESTAKLIDNEVDNDSTTTATTKSPNVSTTPAKEGSFVQFIGSLFGTKKAKSNQDVEAITEPEPQSITIDEKSEQQADVVDELSTAEVSNDIVTADDNSNDNKKPNFTLIKRTSKTNNEDV